MHCLRLSLLWLGLVLSGFAADRVAVDAERSTRLLAAFTSPRPNEHEPAAIALIELGQQVVPDLALLTRDPNAELRARVAQVLGAIGGEAAIEQLVRLGKDPAALVRSYAVLALAEADAHSQLPTIQGLLADQDPGVREAAALALSLVPAVDSLEVLLRAYVRERSREDLDPDQNRRLRRAQAAMQAAITSLVAEPTLVAGIAALLPRLHGPALRLALEATWAVGDPRYGPALAELLVGRDTEAARLAAIGLAANGDSRQVQALTQVTSRADSEALREEAAVALRVLTGHRAGPGQVWELWWRSHSEEVRALYERDRFIAACHDPDYQPEPARLAGFSPEQLRPLVRGVLGEGAPYWPRLAYRHLRADAGQRWIPWLKAELDATTAPRDRVGLIILLADLDLEASRDYLHAQLELLRQQQQEELAQRELHISSERAALEAVLAL